MTEASGWLFSFGSGHVPHPSLDIGLDQLVHVDIEDYSDARAVFVEALGEGHERKWASQYRGDDVDLDTFFPGGVVPLDQARRDKPVTHEP